MTQSRRPRTGVLGLLALLAVAAAIWWLVSGPSGDAGPDGPTTPPMQTDGAERAVAPPPTRQRSDRPRDAPSSDVPTDTEETPSEEEEAPRTTTRVEVRVLADRGGAPIEGAMVLSFSGVRAVTDANGEAGLDGMPVGGVAIRAEAAGWVRSDWTMIDTRDASPGLVVIRLAPGGSLEGIVLNAQDGTPVVNAAITVHAGAGSSVGADPPFAKAESAATGRFRVGGLPPGERVTFRVAAGGYARLEQVVEVPAEPGDPLQIRVQPCGVLAGTVWQPDGEPAAGAQVYVVPTDRPALFASAEAGERFFGRPDWLVAKAGADGRFEVPGLLPDRRYVSIAVRRDSAPSARSAELDPADLPASLDLHLRATGSLRVRLRTPEGGVPREARVFLGKQGIRRSTGEPEREGVWRIDSVTPGERAFHVVAPGFLPYEATADVPSGGVVEVVAELDPGLALAGVVVDEEGNAVPGALVRVGGARGFRASGRAGADGRFRITAVVEGVYGLTATTEGRSGTVRGVRAPASDVRIVMQQLALITAVVRLPDGARVPKRAVAVLQRFSGAGDVDPVNGEAGWSRHSRKLEFRDGAAAVERHVLGVARVRVFVEGFAPAARHFEAAQGATIDLGEIVLEPGFDVRGRVQDASGNPVAGATVSVRECAASARGSVRTLADGSFTLPHATEGVLLGFVSAKGLAQASLAESVRRDAAPLVVTLQALRPLTGIVVDAAGEPLARVRVRCERLDAKLGSRTVRSGEDGRFVVELAPGRYRVQGEGLEPLEVDLLAQTEADVRLARTGE
jgi:hypothetical protein